MGLQLKKRSLKTKVWAMSKSQLKEKEQANKTEIKNQ